MTSTHTDVWVCTDCYFAHHYGYSQRDYQVNDADTFETYWLVGPDCADPDNRTDREPLALLPNLGSVVDNTDSETGEGMQDFSWTGCQGCGSTLGGARYRLALFDS